MFVTIEEGDVVVTQTTFSEAVDIKILYTPDEEKYSLIWKRGLDGEYQLMWRGNWDTCIKEFRDIVGDVFADYLHEQTQARISDNLNMTDNVDVSVSTI